MAQITHGITVTEIPTAIVALYPATSPMTIIGTAPTHLATSPVAANTPRLYNTYAAAVAECGWSTDFANWTVCEGLDCAFIRKQVYPVLVINAFDPGTHFDVVAPAAFTFAANQVTINDPALIPASVTVTVGGTALHYQTDFTISWNATGKPVITTLSPSYATSTAQIGYNRADPSKVTAADMIGGINLLTGLATGLQALNRVYPLYNAVPGPVIANLPGYAISSAVQQAAAAIVPVINGNLKARFCADVDCTTTRQATDAVTWKLNHGNATGPQTDMLWPMGTLGGQLYRYSAAYAAHLLWADARNGGIPANPSNLPLFFDGMALADGTPVALDSPDANYLNGNGIVTGLRYGQSLKVWGNYSSAFDFDTDPHDMWIFVKRMFDYIANTLAIGMLQFTDRISSYREVRDYVETVKAQLNAWVQAEALMRGDVRFDPLENPLAEMVKGHFVFHEMLGVGVPMQWLENRLEFDLSGFATLFGNAATSSTNLTTGVVTLGG